MSAITYFAVTSDGFTSPEIIRTDPPISGEVQIGLLVPLTGDLPSISANIIAFSELAVADVNNYLQERGEPWHIRLVIEDTETDPDVAAQKIELLHSKGITAISGPTTSATVKSVKEYADANDILIVSCCSSAADIAVPGDNIYRLATNEFYEGVVRTKILEEHGIVVLIPAYRGDVWGDSTVVATDESFSRIGGTITEGVRYDVHSQDFAQSASVLAEMVQESVDVHSRDRVAVMLSSFGEGLDFLRAASEYQILHDVLWLGSASLIQEQAVIDDPSIRELAGSVGLLSAAPTVSENEVQSRVKSVVAEQIGDEPISWLYVSYDAVWLIALGMLEAQSTDTDDIKGVIADVADRYEGAGGSMKLNRAGDLASTDHEIWGIQEDGWRVIGTYDGTYNLLTLDDYNLSAQELTVRMVVAETTALYDSDHDGAFATITAMLSTDLSYPFVADSTGRMVAHGANPDLIGGDFMTLIQSDGSFDVLLSELQKGEVWLEYTFQNPVTGTEQHKRSMIVLHDGYVFGAWYYLEDGP